MHEAGSSAQLQCTPVSSVVGNTELQSGVVTAVSELVIGQRCV